MTDQPDDDFEEFVERAKRRMTGDEDEFEVLGEDDEPDPPLTESDVAR